MIELYHHDLSVCAQKVRLCFYDRAITQWAKASKDADRRVEYGKAVRARMIEIFNARGT